MDFFTKWSMRRKAGEKKTVIYQRVFFYRVLFHRAICTENDAFQMKCFKRKNPSEFVEMVEISIDSGETFQCSFNHFNFEFHNLNENKKLIH